MKRKKSKNQQIEMDREVVHGHYYVPTEVANLLTELAQPKANDDILRIGLRQTEPKSPNVTEFVTQTIPAENIIDERQRILDNKEFDVILCAPSFGLVLDESNRPSEEMWLEWGIRHLRNEGRLIIVVPMGLLSNYSQMFMRQFLLENVRVDAIIELPTGWASGVAISASILCITNTNRASTSVKMFQLSRVHDLPLTDLGNFVRGEGSKPFSSDDGEYFLVERSELDYSRLDVKFYDPAYKTFPPSPDYDEVKLKDLVHIRSGDRFDAEEIEISGIPFIQVRNITEKMEIDLRNARRIRRDAAMNSRSFCKSGDVLISIAGTIGKVAVVPDEMEVCIDTSLRRVRIREKSKVLSQYLALFLRSDLAVRQMKRMTSGSVINVLSTPNLENLTIYLPSMETQKKVVKAYHKAIQEAQTQLLSFFPEVDKKFSFTTTGKLLETKAVKQAQEPFLTAVSTKFPFPIARAYSLFTNSSSESGANRVRRLILASEAVVYYSYAILVSDYLKRHSPEDSELNELLISSMYDFRIEKRIKFVNKVIKKAGLANTWSLFVPELIDVPFNFCNEINKSVRNNFAHQEKSEPWCKKQVKDFSPKLEELYKSLSALINYRLVQATSIQVQNGRPQYHMIVMMGNNSIFTPQVEDLDFILPIDTNKVVLLDEDYNALDLHPFYQFQAWESTGMQDHLCFMKQTHQAKSTLTLESLGGSGETEIEIDLQFSNILNELQPNKQV